jgi:hypothetical protein
LVYKYKGVWLPGWAWQLSLSLCSPETSSCLLQELAQSDSITEVIEAIRNGFRRAPGGLDWTLAKAFRISGAKGTGKVRAFENVRISFLAKTMRRDLASFLLYELRNGT